MPTELEHHVLITFLLRRKKRPHLLPATSFPS
jgi:hypothetical protein